MTQALDLEVLVEEIRNNIRTKINAKIDEINAEKDDDIVLEYPAQFIKSLEDETIMEKYIVHYPIFAVPNNPDDSSGRSVRPIVGVIVCFPPQSNSEHNESMYSRYTRVVHELLIENQHLANGDELMIRYVEYSAAMLEGTELEEARVAGCICEFTIGF